MSSSQRLPPGTPSLDQERYLEKLLSAAPGEILLCSDILRALNVLAVILRVV